LILFFLALVIPWVPRSRLAWQAQTQAQVQAPLIFPNDLVYHWLDIIPEGRLERWRLFLIIWQWSPGCVLLADVHSSTG
jgi:hypothetical protein